MINKKKNNDYEQNTLTLPFIGDAAVVSDDPEYMTEYECLI